MINIRSLVTAVTVLVSFAFLIALGNWQMQRLAWKENLIDSINQRLAEDPVPLPNITDDYSLWEYRRFVVRGQFDYDKTFYLFGIAEGVGPGYYLYTPFYLQDGRTVLVNRGWVSEMKKYPSSRPNCCIDGPIELVGKLRFSREQETFVPDNQPDINQWYFANVDEMAASIGVEVVLPFILDAEPLSGFNGAPNGGATRVNITNRHLGYAITWYGLALSLVSVVAVAVWRRKRR